MIEQDFRAVNYAAPGSFNVGFYDGPHTERDQDDERITNRGQLPGRLVF